MYIERVCAKFLEKLQGRVPPHNIKDKNSHKYIYRVSQEE